MTAENRNCNKSWSLCKIIWSKLSIIATPIMAELPYILFFLSLMGGRVPLMFIFAYISAAVIANIRYSPLKWFLKVLMYVFVLSLYLVDLFISENFGLKINPTLFVLLAETTGAESMEFVNQYIFSSAIYPTLVRTGISVLIVVVCEYLWYYLKKRFVYIYAVIRCVAVLVAIPLLLMGISYSNIYWMMYNAQSADHIRFMQPPKDPISSLYNSWLVIRITEKNMADVIEKNRSVYECGESSSAIAEPLNVVVVIGESYIKWHSQLYGYGLETTPNLAREEKEGRLFVFSDVVSSSNYTSVVMRNIMCCNNSSDGEHWYDTPLFPLIFKQAGYNVYMWDNQYAQDVYTTYSFTLNSFLYNPDFREWAYTRTNDVSYRYDGELVDAFRRDIGVLDEGHNLVIFHLMGQHYTYSRRFPPEEFTHFTPDSINRSEEYLKDAHKQRIADYDNATLYNDHVVNSVIEMFKDNNTVLLYFSDHGEEVYDYRCRTGRQYGIMNADILKYQYDVPFMVWCSDKFKSNYPDKVECIKQAIDRPFLTDNICNMLFNVAGIETPYYRDTLDLLNPDYRCSERIINGCKYEDVRFSSKK